MMQIPLQELRRIADSLSLLRGKTVVGAVMRSDQRQLRIELGATWSSSPWTPIRRANPGSTWTWCGGESSSTSSRSTSRALEGVA